MREGVTKIAQSSSCFEIPEATDIHFRLREHFVMRILYFSFSLCYAIAEGLIFIALGGRFSGQGIQAAYQTFSFFSSSKNVCN